MHFNTKYIFAGDSASEIKRKINYNFDQILSFAVGPNGHQGPKGVNGYDGPSGKKGLTGATGLRGALWSKLDDAPTSGNAFDLWIDSNTSDYRVSVLGTTGTWTKSGYSLFNSPYLYVYDGIVGPAGVTDKYAIGIKNGALTESNTSLVIGDDYAAISGINPNRSKLLVSTDDQITRPILTFSKTGAISSGVPSFYWRSTGNSASLRYTSTGNFEISSLLGLSIDSYTARSLLYGDHAVITSLQDVSIGGTGDFYLKSNTTVGVGGNLSITSSNITLSSSSLSPRIPIKIQTTDLTGQIALNTVKSTPSGVSTSGVSILASSTQDSAFEFFDLKNAPIFSAKPRGSVSSGKHAQTTFGSTGGQPAGATGGPYLYPVKRVREVRSPGVTLNAFRYGVTPKTSSIAYNVIDLTSLSLWDSNIILVTPTSYSSVILGPFATIFPLEVFLRIPTFADNNADGLYNNGYANTYRIFLNDISSGQAYRINGLVFNYWKRNPNGTLTPELYFVRFKFQNSTFTLNPPIQTCYVDLTFVGVASTTNGNPRVFWKTCDGISGYISITDRYSLGSIVSTGPNQGGTVVVGPGGGGGGTSV
jgi:hypothetical protein